MRIGVCLMLALSLACGDADSAGSVDEGAADRAEPSGQVEGVEVTYLGHASFLLTSPGGTEVLLDPYASRVWIGYDFPQGIEPDVVAITHPHYDHDAGRFRGAEFPWGEDVLVVDAPGRHEVGDVVIRGVEGKHADPYGMEFGQLNTIMVVEVAGVRFAHLGDNGPLSPESIEGVGEIDVLMMPMDAVYHILSPEETAQVRRDLPHRLLIPMHYRIAEFESDPSNPEDLGEIGPVLESEERVVRVGSHRAEIRAEDLPGQTTIMVFEPIPR